MRPVFEEASTPIVSRSYLQSNGDLLQFARERIRQMLGDGAVPLITASRTCESVH